MIDFDALERALLDRAGTLVEQWLPGGKRVAAEYVCGDLSGGPGGSCSVNLVKGYWADFASDARGKNLLDLYCAVYGMERVPAARQLMVELGWATSSDSPPPQRPARPAPPPKPAENEGWRTVRPVPEHAPPVNYRHHHRKDDDIRHVAEYRVGADLHGYVVRFATSDGGKDPLPRTWCISTRDGAAKWHWRQWDEPRPLYLPGHALPEGRTVVLVEGEKKADALHQLLEAARPGVYAVASWAGGSKAWRKADWAWLQGHTVLCWPDCDAKHEPLTAEERRSQPDKVAQQVLLQSKPLLPEARQPGMQAMLGIGALLRDQHQCSVQLLRIPEPGQVKDGWDCDDAIHEDGWDADRVLAFFGTAYALPMDAASADASPPAPPAPPSAPDAPAGADDEDGDDAFAAHLEWLCDQAKCKRWEIGVNRKLLITALEKAPALTGCLGFNELNNAPSTIKPWPWRESAAVLSDNDDLRLGDWLCRQYKLKPASRSALSEAIETVADQHRFHPIRDWLQSLQHDGKPRLERWLAHTLAMDPATTPERRQRYLSLMGKYMLMGLVARVMQPGVKFDYSPVLEGLTGMGKSTFVKVLVGAEYFSDTHFDIGSGKDGMEQLEGLWAYELSELTAFKRADSEQIKQFFSSTVDRFRGAYGKYVQSHPRQCVIFCTTNKRQYLYDLTSQRRFWPVWIDHHIRVAWLTKWRDQLFAEAFAAWRKGERFFPTMAEEEAYFVPEQRLRLVETTVHAKLYELLTRDGSPPTEGRTSRDLNCHTSFVTLPDLCIALGADPAKSTSLLESQIRAWLDAHGWDSHRETTGARRRGFRRPDTWPPEFEPDEESSAAPPPPAGPGAISSTEPTTAPPPRAVAVPGSDDEPF